MVGLGTLTVVSDRPPPVYSGAKTFAACGRIEVEIEYYNSSAKGLQKLAGKASYARQRKSLNENLSIIQRDSVYVSRVAYWCETENEMMIAIETAALEGGQKRWVLSVNERLAVSLESPVSMDEEVQE